jgi:fibronectin type 3 domain-containing protein
VASAEPLVESVASNEACVEVKDVVAPAPPTGLTALAQEDGIEVRWSSSPEVDVVAYRVYRMAVRGRPEPIGKVQAPATRFLDQDAPANGRLRYLVSAVDGADNESAPTLPVDVTRP